ncbi:MAG TPA: HAD family hydrolase [Candidatus Binatia bacterium]|nr:HAD family hydrolase [Candidatus Binatia bacterium]
MAIAALFDVDGTLIGRNSAALYMSHLRRTGQARRRDLARTLWFLLQYKLGLLDIQSALATGMSWVRGRDEAAMAEDCRTWYANEVRAYVFPAMARLVEAHREAGHLPVLLTSATRYLAEPLGADLGIRHHLVSQLVVADGRFTGEAVRPVCYGRGKVWWAEQFAATHDVDLATSYFYTDSITDLPVLELVGHPRVVHPDPRLRRVAQQRGWTILRPRLGEVSEAPLALVG